MLLMVLNCSVWPTLDDAAVLIKTDADLQEITFLAPILQTPTRGIENGTRQILKQLEANSCWTRGFD